MAIFRGDLKCFICNKSIVGRYYYDWAGHCICESHYSSIVKCASCGQFCNSKAKPIGNEEMICQHCQTYRIEQQDADNIIIFIKQQYAKVGIEIGAKWHLKMISAEALFQKTKDKNTRGLAQMYGSEYTIYVYRELSRVAFAQVIAHELLHVYQYARNIHTNKAKSEGFCNLGSYLILKAIDNPEANAAIQNLKKSEDPIYGDGFRQMLVILEKSGWQAVLNEIRR